MHAHRLFPPMQPHAAVLQSRPSSCQLSTAARTEITVILSQRRLGSLAAAFLEAWSTANGQSSLLFCPQPTAFRHCIHGHRTPPLLSKSHTFRFNLCCSGVLLIDHDGNQMINFWRSEERRV